MKSASRCGCRSTAAAYARGPLPGAGKPWDDFGLLDWSAGVEVGLSVGAEPGLIAATEGGFSTPGSTSAAARERRRITSGAKKSRPRSAPRTRKIVPTEVVPLLLPPDRLLPVESTPGTLYVPSAFVPTAPLRMKTLRLRVRPFSTGS